jgi:hypothetical protein
MIRRSLFALSLTALAALADDGATRPQTGDTGRWTCTTEFTYGTGEHKFPCGQLGKTKASEYTTMALDGTVQSVASDGTTTWIFSVAEVRLESKHDKGGAKVEWDSKSKKEAPVAGIAKFVALVGVTFTTTVGADGTVKSCSLEAWPTEPREALKEGKFQQELAAATMRDPIPAAAWMSLIFETGPAGKKEWSRRLQTPQAQEMEMKLDGSEYEGGESCARVKFETEKKPKSGEKLPNEVCKSGKAWWSKAGWLVKAEVRGGEETAYAVKGSYGELRLEVDLVKREKAK